MAELEGLAVNIGGDASAVAAAFADAYANVLSFKQAVEGLGDVNLGGITTAMRDISASVANTDQEMAKLGAAASAAFEPVAVAAQEASQAFDWDALVAGLQQTGTEGAAAGEALQKSMQDAGQAAQEAGNKTEDGAKRGRQEVEGVTGAADGLKHAMEAVAGAVVFEKITEGFRSMMEEAGRATIESQRFINTMKGVGSASDPDALFELADALEKVSTFEAEDTIQAASMLARFGLQQKAIEGLIPSIQDFAAAMGKDVVSSADQVGRAIEIGSAGLRGLNLGFTKSQRAAFDLANEQQRAATIMQAFQSQMGGAAALAASTAEGAFKQYDIAVKNIAESLGKMTDKPVAAFMGQVTGALQGLTARFDALSDGSKQAITLLLGGIAGLGALAAAFVSVGGAVGTIVAVWPKVTEGFAALRTFAAAASGSLLGMLAPLAAIAAAITVVIFTIGTLRMAWDTDLGGMRTAITGWAKDIKELWTALVDWMGDKFHKAADAISEAFIRTKGALSGSSQKDIDSEVFQSKQKMQLVPVVEDGGLTLEKTGAFLGKVFDEGVAGLKDFAKLLGLDFDKFTKVTNAKTKGTSQRDGNTLDFQNSGAIGGLEVMAAAANVSAQEFEEVAAFLGGSAAAAQQILAATKGQAQATIQLLAFTAGSADVAAQLTQAFQGDADVAAKVLEQVGGSVNAATQLSQAFYGQTAGVAELLQSLGGNVDAANTLAQAFSGNAQVAQQFLTALGGDVQTAAQIGEAFNGNADAAAQVLQATKGNAELTASLGYSLRDNVDAIKGILAATGGNAAQAASMAQSFSGTAAATKEANDRAAAYWGSAAGKAAMAGPQMEDGLKTAIAGITQHMGAAGSLISGAMQAAATGGPFAAIAAVIVQIVSQCQSFMNAVSILNDILSQSAQAFNPLFDAMGPILQVVAQVSGQISESLGQVFEQLAPVLQIVVYVVQALGELLGSLVGAVFNVINTMLSAVMPVVQALLPIINLVVQLISGIAPLFQLLTVAMLPLTLGMQLTAQIVQQMKPVLDLLFSGLQLLFGGIIKVAKYIGMGVNAMLDGIASLLNFIGQAFEPAKALAKSVSNSKLDLSQFDKGLANVAGATNQVTTGFDRLKAPLQSTSQELSNVPAILKVTRLRFESAMGDSSTGPLDTTSTAYKGASTEDKPEGSNTVNITNLTVQGQTPQDALKSALKNLLEGERFTVTGSTQAQTAPNATPRTAGTH